MIKPLFVPLTGHWYDEFAAGRKTWELRRYGRQWTDKHVYPGRAVTLSRGYGKQHRMARVIGRVHICLGIQLEGQNYEDAMAAYGHQAMFDKFIAFECLSPTSPTQEKEK